MPTLRRNVDKNYTYCCLNIIAKKYRVPTIYDSVEGSKAINYNKWSVTTSAYYTRDPVVIAHRFL